MNMIQAVRALNSAFDRSESLAAQEEGARYDHQFDGGEWSDAFHASTLEAVRAQIATRVARAFDVDPEALLDAHLSWAYDTEGRSLSTFWAARSAPQERGIEEARHAAWSLA